MGAVAATTSLVDFLDRQDEEAWSTSLTELLPAIHEVDRAATLIWFAFFPLRLRRALQEAADPEQLARQLLLEGQYDLAAQIDTAAHFLSGHRYWSEVKRAVLEHAEGGEVVAPATHLDQKIKEIAKGLAAKLKVEASLLTGVTAVALMTLQQVGIEAFRAGSGDAAHAKSWTKSPEQVLRNRARDDGQGLFGFLRTADKRWTVTFDERDAKAKFTLINDEEIASAAARDPRDWRAHDPRRIEGPIPVQCRSASCGTCWVGVLGGAEKLSDMTAREIKKLKEFGYLNCSEPKPIIRLACMARATGALSIVIPPWNGVFGKYLAERRDGSSVGECAAATAPAAEEDSSSQ